MSLDTIINDGWMVFGRTVISLPKTKEVLKINLKMPNTKIINF